MNILRSLVLLLSVSTLVSCSGTRSKKPTPVGPVLSALQSGHWHQVRKTPPTYFPKGIPADHPTDYRDGFWVNSGDSQGSRFFIPAHGTSLPQEHLIAEAQKTMTPAARKELKRQGQSNLAGGITTKTVEGVSKVFGGAAHAVAKVGDVIPGLPSRSKAPPGRELPGPSPSTPSAAE